MNIIVFNEIKKLADKYASELNQQVNSRMLEMQKDDKSHYLVYRVLGITTDEGELIDSYQNKGRFLYKYAGSFLEEATILCFKHKYSTARKIRIDNTISQKPSKFEIDCLVDNYAIEIKWRDATTDGDHITKEHTRVKAIRALGYIPIRIMFYFPNREQAKRIQETIETLYIGVGGKYYFGDKAWQYVNEMTEIDLLEIMEKIARERN